jgi:hypothetical protein
VSRLREAAVALLGAVVVAGTIVYGVLRLYTGS